MSLYPSPAEMEEVSLLDVVDTALDKGIVLQGDATISVADVDLVFLGLRLVLASVDTVDRGRSLRSCPTTTGTGGGRRKRAPEGRVPAAVPSRTDHAPLHIAAEREPAAKADTSARAGEALTDADKMEQGLAKLVLTIVELLRQLLERQALRRMARGSLSDDEIERMGTTFQRLEEKMGELKRVFGLKGEELSLNLGPLGNLM